MGFARSSTLRPWYAENSEKKFDQKVNSVQCKVAHTDSVIVRDFRLAEKRCFVSSIDSALMRDSSQFPFAAMCGFLIAPNFRECFRRLSAY